jgi:N-acetylglucosamine kinase-like BadF-type ATPase
MNILIADCGATKSEWVLLHGGKKKKIETLGISPYFLDSGEIADLLKKELLPGLKQADIDQVYYYGTGCLNPDNVKIVKKALKGLFPAARLHVTDDLMGAALGLCGTTKGMVSNLGTGSFAIYFDGKKIAKSSPGLGFILGDEGSGAYLGKKVVQYYLYNTFDEELRYKFDAKYVTNRSEILENVYKKPFPNRYLAAFTLFLFENRGHYMIENIIEDGLNDFFFNHLCKYRESWKLPIHFVGGVAYGFKDVVRDLCAGYEFELGQIMRKPMDGLIVYHSNKP